MLLILQPTVNEDKKENVIRSILLVSKFLFLALPVAVIILLFFMDSEWIYYLFGVFVGTSIIRGSLNKQQQIRGKR
jgi:hypothetical protein